MILKVRNLDSQTLLAHRVEVARTFKTRFKGLLGRAELPTGDGLLIVPCRQVHTFFMKFVIDVVFLDKKDRVIGIHHELAPWRLSSYHPDARSTLELPAGTLKSTRTEPGHRLTFDPDPSCLQ